MARSSVLILLLACLALVPERASACATCACGDPTLTLFGSEKPFEGRIRGTFEYRHRREISGISGVNRQEVTEDRFTLGAAWAPVEALVLGLQIPAVRKNLVQPNLAEETAFGVGDIDVNARYFIWGLEARPSRHLVAVTAALRLPVSQSADDSAGAPMPVEAQPGVGAWAGGPGLWYGYFRDPWSAYVTVNIQLFAEGRQSYEPATAVLTSTAVQYQFVPQVAVQLGLDMRWSGKDEEGGTVVPNTGGSVLFVSPAIVASPMEDLVFQAVLRIPAADSLRGDHKEGLNVQGGIVYDFGS